MKIGIHITLILTSLLTSISAAPNAAFVKEVESTLRDASKSDEGLADPGGVERLKRAMAKGGDWDGALLCLIDRDKYDDPLIENAIAVLRFRGTFGRPEVQAAVISYFKSRVKAARAHDRADPLFDAVVRTGIAGLSSSFAKSGGSDLLLAILDFAVSEEEQANPLLDKYTHNTIAAALLEKADSRHLDGMRKLLTVTKEAAVKEKLKRAILKVGQP